MILKSFFATNVHGDLNFNFSVNDDVSFLVGSNGSGKTTALNFINILLTPNLEALMTLTFKEAILTINHEKKDLVIYACHRKDKVRLSVSDVNGVLSIPDYSDLDEDYLSEESDIYKSIFSEVIKEHSRSDVVKRITSIPTPIFLGIDRRGGYDEVSIDYYKKREGWENRNINSRASRVKRVMNSSTGVSLIETEWLIQDTYERLKKIEQRYSKVLRDNILMSAFKYTEINANDVEAGEAFWKDKKVFLKRKGEVIDAISNLGMIDSKLLKEIDIFFEKIENLLMTSSDIEHGIWNIELLANKAQIDRIVSIVKAIDSYKFKSDYLFKQVNLFLESVNYFFKDSGKKVSLDFLGKLTISNRNGSACRVNSLSSGEKQILVIFAHAFFSRYKQEKETVFIIDEPEMSLHLRWQERFSDIILNAVPNSQFLLATHSPEIISANKEKAIKCR